MKDPRPSSANRWINCERSRLIEHDAGDEDETGPAASEGQAAHRLASDLLSHGLEPFSRLGEQIPDDDNARTWPVTHDMAGDIARYGQVAQRLIGPESIIGVEERVAFTRTDDGPLRTWFLDLSGRRELHEFKLKGTSDFFAYDPVSKRLDILDLKYGRNVLVEVQDNWQLLLYLLAVVETHQLDPDRIRLHIFQPRAHHPDGELRSTEVDPLFLDYLRDTAAMALLRSGAPDATFTATEDGLGHCRFCSAAGQCPALFEKMRQTSQVIARDAGTPVLADEPQPPELLSSDVLGRALTAATIIGRWAKRAREVAAQRAMEEEVPGWKLIHGRKSRAFRSDVTAAQIEEALGADFDIDEGSYELLSPSTLRSPAQIEKDIGKKKFNEHLQAFLDHAPAPVRLAAADEKGENVGYVEGVSFDAE